jgi:hypothetical protein
MTLTAPFAPSLPSSLTPSFTLTMSSIRRHSSPSPRRLFAAARAPVSTTLALPRSPPSPPASPTTRAPRAGKASLHPLVRAPRSTVDPSRATRSTCCGPGPHVVDLVHRIFHCKINTKINYPRKFAKRPLGCFVIKPQSTKILRRPLVFKIFPKMPVATFQKFQIGPYNFFSPYLRNRNSDFGTSCTKILRITSSFILCIH